MVWFFSPLCITSPISKQLCGLVHFLQLVNSCLLLSWHCSRENSASLLRVQVTVIDLPGYYFYFVLRVCQWVIKFLVLDYSKQCETNISYCFSCLGFP